ncbi:MAG: DUF362 domain-containing protein, partial [Lachnospiraceae bacterium]|nr:DUF362 domain-containing protein [Lachnospiraceae bacterium]
MIQTLYHVTEYKEEFIYSAVCKAMDALAVGHDMHPDLKVVIKPNLVMAKSPEFPATTHPLVIKAVVRWLKEQGVSIIFVSHHMNEIFELCDSYTVLKDGCFVSSGKVKEVHNDDLIQM